MMQLQLVRHSHVTNIHVTSFGDELQNEGLLSADDYVGRVQLHEEQQ
jgi:hypothetical protein